MCDCKKEIEAQLLEQFKTNAPQATDHSVELQGFGFGILCSQMVLRQFTPYKFTATHPLKKGGTKQKTETGFINFNFCPFCGGKFKKDEVPNHG